MEAVEGTTTTAPAISLTDGAVTKLSALLSEESEPQALRVAVTGGGCSGFQYALGFDTEQHSDDLVFEQGGVRVFIDETSAEYLNGSVIDFQDGLNGKGFAIENPNATGGCGCGQSFSC